MPSAPPLQVFRDALCFPPSTHGANAAVAIESLVELIPKRAEALRKLEMARSRLMVFIAEAVSTSKTAAQVNRANLPSRGHESTAQRLRESIRSLHADVDTCYAQYVAMDAAVVQCQRDLSLAYPYIHVATVDTAESVFDDYSPSLGGSTQPTGSPNLDTAIAESTPHTPDSHASRGHAVPHFNHFSECIYAIVKKPELQDFFPTAVAFISTMTKLQAVSRGVRVRRRYRSLLRMRRYLDDSNVAHQFYWWRAYTRSTTFCRRHLQRVGVAAFQANANMMHMRRRAFALHFMKLRSFSTLQRTFVVWSRYCRYLKAPVNPNTKSRDVTFAYDLEAWNNFLTEESKRLQIQAKCALFGGGRDPVLICAHYLYRWRRYVKNRLRMRHLWIMATTHYELVSTRKHFHGWVHYVSFSAQREAWRLANLGYYLARWHRGVKLSIAEETAVKQFVKPKTLTIMVHWRRQALTFRMRKAMSTYVLQHHRSLMMFAVACWSNDRMLQVFVGALRNWRRYTFRRQAWKAYVAQRWAKRQLQLKQLAFYCWSKLVAEERNKPLKTKLKITNPKLVLIPSQQEMNEELANITYRSTLRYLGRIAYDAAGRAKSLVGEGSPIAGTNLFERDCLPSLPSQDQFSFEKLSIKDAFAEWARLSPNGDPALKTCVAHLLVHYANVVRPRAQHRSAASFLSRKVDPDSHETSRWDTLMQIFVSVGQPLISMEKKECNIAALEDTTTQESMTNVARRIGRDRKHGRVLSRINTRIAAVNLFQVDRYFSCAPVSSRLPFTPYRKLMEGYEAMGASNPALRRNGKFTIPIPPPPRRRHLPYLLRVHQAEMIGEEGYRRIQHRALVTARTAAVIAYAKLAFFLLDSGRGDKEAAAKRELAVKGFGTLEARELSKEFLERKYRKIGPKMTYVAPLPPQPILNILGFNPKFLRGETHREAKKTARMRRLMREAGTLMEPLYEEMDYKLRRAISDIFGLKRAEHAKNRFDAKHQPRPKSANPNPVGRGWKDKIDAEDAESLSSQGDEEVTQSVVQDDTARDGSSDLRLPAPLAELIPAALEKSSSALSGVVSDGATPRGVGISFSVADEVPVTSSNGADQADDQALPSSETNGVDSKKPSSTTPTGTATKSPDSRTTSRPTLSPPAFTSAKTPVTAPSTASDQARSRPSTVTRSPVELPKSPPAPVSTHHRGATAQKGNDAGTTQGDGVTRTDTPQESLTKTNVDPEPVAPPAPPPPPPKTMIDDDDRHDDDEEIQDEVVETNKEKKKPRRRYVPPPSPTPIVRKFVRPTKNKAAATPAEAEQEDFGLQACAPPPLPSASRNVNSVERLVEVSARYSGYLTDKSRVELDRLKLQLAKFVATRTADPEPELASQRVQGASDTVTDDTAANAASRMKKEEWLESRRIARANFRDAPLYPVNEAPLFSSTRVRATPKSTPNLASQPRPASVQSAQGSPGKDRKRDRQTNGNGPLDVTAQRDFTRHQLIRVPMQGTGPADVYAKMQSTASLLNGTLDAFAFASRHDATASAERPRPKILERIASAKEAAVTHDTQANPALDDEFSAWVSTIRDASTSQQTNTSQQDLVDAEKDLLQRKLVKLNTLPSRNDTDALRGMIESRLSHLSPGATPKPPAARGAASPSFATMRGSSVDGPTPAKAELSDEQVGRLIGYIVSKAQSM